MKIRNLLVAGVAVFLLVLPHSRAIAQDSTRAGGRSLTHEEELVVDSIRRDIGTVSMEGIPPTPTFGNGCNITMFGVDRNGLVRRIVYETCFTVLASGDSLGRIRSFDVRPGRTRRELFVVVISQRNFVGICEVYVDRGFREGGDPSGELVHYRERVCGETKAELTDLIRSFMNRP